MRLKPCLYVKRVKSQRSAESCGFSPGTPVSSHRERWQGGLGKKGPQELAYAVVGTLVGKAK
jgi:hypothetical protein